MLSLRVGDTVEGAVLGLGMREGLVVSIVSRRCSTERDGEVSTESTLWSGIELSAEIELSPGRDE